MNKSDLSQKADSGDSHTLAQKKKTKHLKKAPQAPKRFKSSYILFFIHVQENIKKSLPVGHASAPQVSKKASEMWKSLSAAERLHWDNEAAKEKQRYLAEKEIYTGPWQVPQKRARKDPTAPKRNPSAFLLFSLTKRKELKESNPELKNTEISRILGELWRKTDDREKQPFIEQEVIEREKYKEKMTAWREQKAIDDEIKKQERDEKMQQVLEAKAKAEQEKKENLLLTEHENSAFKIRTSTQRVQRNEEYNLSTPNQYHQYSPLQHPDQSYIDHYNYGQQQVSWQAPETLIHQNSANTPYRSIQYNHQIMSNGPEKYCNTFDVFQTQQNLVFSEPNSLYDHSHQRSIRLEDRIDSPYSYNADEFDPVPIH